MRKEDRARSRGENERKRDQTGISDRQRKDLTWANFNSLISPFLEVVLTAEVIVGKREGESAVT